MTLHLFAPSASLRPFIQVLWLMEDEQPGHKKERVLPDGCVEMVINLEEDRIHTYDPQQPERFERRRGIVVCGAHSEYMVIDTEAQARVMGVHFRPGGAWPFLGVPTRDLSNQTLSLEKIWGESALELHGRLTGAGSHETRIGILQTALLQKLRRGLNPHPAVAWTVSEIEAATRPRTLTEITAEIGLSSRRFIELFSREVGLTPKRYDRIRRFQRVVQTVHALDEVRWADVAVSCGYFDQAHFIHDFRSFCGMTPAAYFAHRNLRHANHVPLAG